MLSYQEAEQDLWDLISELGKVYTETVPGSSALLEEAEETYENLIQEYEVKIIILKRFSSKVIKESFGCKYEWKWHMMYGAAKEGNLEVMIALRDGSLGRIFSWDPWVAIYAAAGGHLEVLRVLRDGSLGSVCPWNKLDCRSAARKHPKIIKLINSGKLD